MIVLFSYEGDRSTNRLIDWLHYYRCPYKRIHLEDEDFQNIEIEIDDNQIRLKLKLQDGEVIDISKCDYFYNRGKKFTYRTPKNDTSIPDFIINKYLKQEYETIVNYFYSEINKKSIGSFSQSDHFKLQQLKAAQVACMDIPDSLLTKNNNFPTYFSSKKHITKAVQDNIAIRHQERLYVQRVQRTQTDELEDSFFPSFFQEEIQKDFEIRSFFLDGLFYSICFQSNSSNIDMRDNYSVSEYEPFELPDNIEKKLVLIMRKLQLTSGSIDLIKSKSNKFYFLEVNPNGQYDWVSKYGGYYLDEKIARFLLSKTKNNQSSNLL
jgi:hypothetical protein